MMQKLNEIPGNNPFKVPENYFEGINKKIISVTSGYNPEVKKVELYSRFRLYFLIAASVAGFILLSYTALKLLTPGKNNLQVSEVMYEGYPDMYVNDIDVLTLEENAAARVLFEKLPEVTKSDIIDCLLLENIEINDIYKNL